ncbi:DUF4389 domain-containing protein [Agromyces protaetiae]|uniref:DUF4389 domain-containing protein n=1 Tax=Agromyces protaetiae TaxID=2509455 RepID=A0A4P6FSY4_9MICO|nr:DUF4389 domain-containing protein [Agromyces protaetiae]QAY73678.1 DUF4389 domain-containing protein [Agromyces protaetiae]
MSTSTDLKASPLRLTGTLQAGLSRWLWLAKMLLAIPHFVILAALWLWFIATTPIAGIAILATGRYPRRLFEINTGILRWNWRVGFYVYAALGTDDYPPFTARRTSYPATLEIEYADRLSRPAVLVKALLALPQIAIVALLGADIFLYPIPALNELSTGPLPLGGYSILNLLVVVAGFLLLVTGRYPTGYFDFLVGISRWMYRVLIYLALMTDEYPPFRLDAGGDEPDHATSLPAAASRTA